MNFKEFIKSLDMFKNCSDEVIEYITKFTEETDIESGNLIFNEGSVGEYVYIIYSGQVEIVKNYGKDDQKLLSVLNPKEVFGEMSLFSTAGRSASAVTKTQSKILKINAKHFEYIFANYSKDGIRIIEWLLFNTISRLEQTSKELASVYSISHLMIRSATEAQGLKLFLTNVCKELDNVIDPEFVVGIYIYNKFNEEYELVSISGQRNQVFKDSFDKNDNFVVQILDGKFEDIDGIKIYSCPMIYAKTIVGFVLITSPNKKFTQRVIDLINSITNLIAVGTVNLRHIQEEQEKARLQQMKSRYTM